MTKGIGINIKNEDEAGPYFPGLGIADNRWVPFDTN